MRHGIDRVTYRWEDSTDGSARVTGLLAAGGSRDPRREILTLASGTPLVLILPNLLFLWSFPFEISSARVFVRLGYDT